MQKERKGHRKNELVVLVVLVVLVLGRHATYTKAEEIASIR